MLSVLIPLPIRIIVFFQRHIPVSSDVSFFSMFLRGGFALFPRKFLFLSLFLLLFPGMPA